MAIATRSLLRLAALLLMIAGAISEGGAQPTGGRNETPAVVRIGETQKVCQLTGDIDWETGRPTANQTLKNFGLDAVDLGYPVEHNGKVIFLFGDAWPPPHGGGPLAEVIPDDAVGETTQTEPPTPEKCIDLLVHNKVAGGKKAFFPATINGPVKVKQGFFNVPSGGVSVKGALYAFFWTDHCSPPAKLAPNPEHPLERPAPQGKCPESNELNSIGRGVLARSEDGGHFFSDVVPMPEGFVYSIAVNANTQRGLPPDQNLGVYIFSVPRYRASVPYMAFVPIDTFADPGTWRFFAGLTPDGKPKWVSRSEWKPGPDKQIYTPVNPAGYNVGEFSITWNVPLHTWLMMYGGMGPGGPSVVVRVAPAPWGPWSFPATLLGPADHPGCKLTMTAEGCGSRRDYWPGRRRGDKYQPGGFYAPFVINRYTRPEGEHRATIYWTLSTWNPYEVDIMNATIELPADAGFPTPVGPKPPVEPVSRPPGK